MKNYTILFIIAITPTLSACGDFFDTLDNEEHLCNLVEASCTSINKKLDAQNCLCVDLNAPVPSMQCSLTEASCISVNKKLDAQNCVCVDNINPQSCNLTEASCSSINKKLDVQKCECTELTTNENAQCNLSKAACESEDKKLDAKNCKCTSIVFDDDSPCPASASHSTEAYCRSINKIIDTKSCFCINDFICDLTEAICQSEGRVLDEYRCSCIEREHPIAIGDLISFGHYEQDGNSDNGKEPIAWRVLAVESDKIMVISELILDMMDYNNDPVVDRYKWETSDIRAWLNGYVEYYKPSPSSSITKYNFYDLAFNSNEKEKIITTTVPPHFNPNPGSEGFDQGKETHDKIFLISSFEFENYFPHNNCLVYLTKYAQDQANTLCYASSLSIEGLMYYSGCVGAFWFFRTLGYGGPVGATVRNENNNACVVSSGTIANMTSGIRPAMWLKYSFK